MRGEKTFASADDMWIAAIEDALANGSEVGSREGASREVLGWSAMLMPGSPIAVANEARKFSAQYAGAETLWYLSGSARIDLPLAYALSYAQWANDGEMVGAVGGRLSGDPDFDGVAHLVSKDGWTLPRKLEAAIALMRREPNTRRCVIPFWSGGDLVRAQDGVTRNVPCYVAWQALPRGGALHWVTTMRSQDAWLGMPYDVFAFACVQRIVARALDLAPGWYVHQCGSLHLYDKHAERAKRAIEAAGSARRGAAWAWPFRREESGSLHARWAIGRAIATESALRAGSEPRPDPLLECRRLLAGGGGIAASLLWCASRAWDRRRPVDSLRVDEALCPALATALAAQEKGEQP